LSQINPLLLYHQFCANTI